MRLTKHEPETASRKEKPADKKVGKTHKKKVCSLRHQLEFFFIGLLVVSMCTITAINFCFWNGTISQKTEVLEAAVNDLQN